MGAYKKIGRSLPYLDRVRELVESTGVKIKPERLTGFEFISSLMLSALVGTFIYYFTGLSHLFIVGLPTAIFVVSKLILFLSLYVILERKKTFVERVLPDALLLMAANVRSGMTPGKALLMSAKDEFGPLKEEVKKTGRDIMTGKGLEKALKDFRDRTVSETVERVLSLIISSIRTGGELAVTLEETADNVRSLEIAEKRIKSNVVMYVIFILIASGFGAPLLFSLSLFLVGAVSRFGGVEMPERVQQASMFQMGSPTVSTDFIFWFSLITLGVISVSGGFILGAIRSGEAKKGWKFIPLLLLLSYGVFFLSYRLVTSLFSGFFI